MPNEVPMTAMIAEDNITRLQVFKHPGSVSFLTQIGVRRTEKYTPGEVVKHGFFEITDGTKKVVKIQIRNHC